MRQFDAMIEEKLGPKEVANAFGEMGLEETPTFEKYEENSVEGTSNETLKELKPTPDLSTDV